MGIEESIGFDARGVKGASAQSQSSDLCVREKQYWHRWAQACPVNALFHKVGSIFAQTALDEAAASCRNRRS